MRRILVTLLLLIITGQGALASGPLGYATSPDSMLSEIGDRGAPDVAIELYDSESWRVVMQKIEAGDRDWLLVALALFPGTDGAASEELSLTVSQALLTNPEAVLELFMTVSRPRFDLCHGWGEFAGHRTFESAFAEVQAKIKKLEAVSDPSLAEARDACLKTLRSAEPELRRIYSESSD